MGIVPTGQNRMVPMSKVYVAGPMRGYPEFNFPAFNVATVKLQAAGHTVFNPAARDAMMHGEDFSKSNPDGDIEQAEKDFGFSLREAMAADLAWICEHADAIFLLKGWEKSAGAKCERALALTLGINVWYAKGAHREE